MEEDNNHLSVDLDWIKTKEQISFINNLIYNSLNIKEINFSYQHHGLYNIFKTQKDINLYNIDHHHDVHYEDPNDVVNEGNWIYHLIAKKCIKQYHWIKNIDSQIQFNFPQEMMTTDYEYHVHDNYNFLEKINFQSISIVLSPEYTSMYLQPLYEAYIDYFKFHKKTVKIIELSKNHKGSLLRP
jgi:hypothetical protein